MLNDRTKFSIEFRRTETDAILSYIEIGEDLLLEPVSIMAGLFEEGGGQGFGKGLVMYVLDIHMVVDLRNDMGSV